MTSTWRGAVKIEAPRRRAEVHADMHKVPNGVETSSATNYLSGPRPKVANLNTMCASAAEQAIVTVLLLCEKFIGYPGSRGSGRRRAR
eukprot:5864139-Pleurochrysis_carterae.AAC.1